MSPMTTHALVAVFTAVQALHCARSVNDGVAVTVAPDPAANVTVPVPARRKSKRVPTANATDALDGNVTVTAVDAVIFCSPPSSVNAGVKLAVLAVTALYRERPSTNATVAASVVPEGATPTIFLAISR